MEQETVSQPTPQESPGSNFLTRLKEKLHIKIPKRMTFILAALVPFTVIAAASGGTYLIATNAFNPVDSLNLPSQDSLVSNRLLKVPTVTLTPEPTKPEPTGIPFVNPTSAPDATANWPSYTFNAVGLTFKYPPGWNVYVGNTSGAPYLYVRNFTSTGSATLQDTSGEYLVRISRFDQVGITSTSQLQTQLNANLSSIVNEDGSTLGTITVATTSAGKINGYPSLGRIIFYSSNPTQQIPEVFVLNTKGTVVRAVPKLDVNGGRNYFNQIVSTFSFGN